MGKCLDEEQLELLAVDSVLRVLSLPTSRHHLAGLAGNCLLYKIKAETAIKSTSKPVAEAGKSHSLDIE
ncbi:hypothetical protein TSUD_47760 [Trifolium subterraneum]|nr:hypothetical protein TSUD_47760 [Trifolium subterraneum]